ncbi:hypothetical protein GE061_014659 [Apolygus lucorum]|uniref:BESS domain-containing protein n=1 Tax=Apolygus lucorum TaxID=248454 RepID=A0A8S9XIW9_APOLU|nr:hypothetical protein GE061_014659 [Apolygus lucorum]
MTNGIHVLPDHHGYAPQMREEPLMDVPSGYEDEHFILIKEEPGCEKETSRLLAMKHLASNDDTEEPQIDPISGDPIPLELDEDDLKYFRSLVPDLIRLTPELKQVFRIKVENVLKELVSPNH